MKNFLIVILLLLGSKGVAQDKCYCNLVKNYTKDAGRVYPGEKKETVPVGMELWIDMRPVAHQRNQGEKGGCRLIAGEEYIIDQKTGDPIRALECGNPIVDFEWYPLDLISRENNLYYSTSNQKQVKELEYLNEKIEDNSTQEQTFVFEKPELKLTGNLQTDVSGFSNNEAQKIKTFNDENLWKPFFLLKQVKMKKGWSIFFYVLGAGLVSYGLSSLSKKSNHTDDIDRVTPVDDPMYNPAETP